MKIYNHSGYGHASIICSPGNDDPVDPQREEWHELVPTPEGRIRKVRSICVKFAGGVAEVSDALGEYMVAQDSQRRSGHGKRRRFSSSAAFRSGGRAVSSPEYRTAACDPLREAWVALIPARWANRAAAAGRRRGVFGLRHRLRKVVSAC